MASRLYFRQMLAGRDFAQDDFIAKQMVNFTYLIGDPESRDAVIVDPAYGVGELVETLAADDMRLVGVLVTHYHPDHVGGDLMGHSIEGLHRLLELQEVPVHVQGPEAYGVNRVTGVSEDILVTHASGDVVEVGTVPVELIHTPGHTPGSQC
ncbi:MAG: MBL fold metallo-hydrolase, partial [Acidimicrobiales bacterium]